MAKRRVAIGRIIKTPKFKQDSKIVASQQQAQADSEVISENMRELLDLDYRDSSPTNLVKITAALAEVLNSALRQRATVQTLSEEEHKQYVGLLNDTLLQLRVGFHEILASVQAERHNDTITDKLAMGQLEETVRGYLESIDKVLAPAVAPLFQELKQWLDTQYKGHLAEEVKKALAKVSPVTQTRLAHGERVEFKELVEVQTALVEVKEMVGKELPKALDKKVKDQFIDAQYQARKIKAELPEDSPLIKAWEAQLERLEARFEKEQRAERKRQEAKEKALERINKQRDTLLRSLYKKLSTGDSDTSISMSEWETKQKQGLFSKLTGGKKDLGLLEVFLERTTREEGSLLTKVFGDYQKEKKTELETLQESIDQLEKQIKEQKEYEEEKREAEQELAQLDREKETRAITQEVQAADERVKKETKFLNRRLDDMNVSLDRLAQVTDSVYEQVNLLDDQKHEEKKEKKKNPFLKDQDENQGAGGGGLGDSLLGGALKKGGSFVMKNPAMSAGIAAALYATVKGVYKYNTAEDSAQRKDAVGEAAGGAVGGLAGAKVGGLAGAKIGGAIGAMFGGVGAVPGAAIGGLIGAGLGALGGLKYGGAIGSWISNFFKSPQDSIPDEVKKLGPDAELLYLEKEINPQIVNSTELSQDEKIKALKKVSEYAKKLNNSDSSRRFVAGISDKREISEALEKGHLKSYDEMRKKYTDLDEEGYARLSALAAQRLQQAGKGINVESILPEEWQKAENLGTKTQPVNYGLGVGVKENKEGTANKAFERAPAASPILGNMKGAAPKALAAGGAVIAGAGMSSGSGKSVTGISENAHRKDLINKGRYTMIQRDGGQVEVREGGTRSWRNNNPGNFKFEGKDALARAQKRYQGVVGIDDGGFAIFNSMEAGRAANRQWFKSDGRANWSLAQAIAKYAPKHENNVERYIQALEATGVNRNTLLSQLSDDQLDKLLAAIKKHEGFKEGVVSYRGQGQTAQTITDPTTGANLSPIVNQQLESLNSNLYAQTQNAINKGIKYGFGSKSLASGAIDCSGWISHLNRQYIDAFNEQSKDQKIDPKNKKLFQDSAAGIIKNVSEKTGEMWEGDQINEQTAHEGMLIGTSNGGKWAKGRYKGIDHIVQVVRDPNTGELMVSESRGKKGVTLTPLNQYLERQRKKGVKMTATSTRGLVENKNPYAANQQGPVVDSTAPKTVQTTSPVNQRGQPQMSQMQAAQAMRQSGPLNAAMQAVNNSLSPQPMIAPDGALHAKVDRSNQLLEQLVAGNSDFFGNLKQGKDGVNSSFASGVVQKG